MIYGKRIRLRAAERNDLPKFTTWLNDPEVKEGLMIYAPLSLASEEKWFEKMLERPQDEQVLVIEVENQGEWMMIGNCGYHNIDWRSRSAEVGIFIGEKGMWNKGYGTEVMKLLLDYGFTTLNLNRIALIVYATNKRAIRAYEKAGFVPEGRFREAMYQKGKYIDVIQMAVLRSDWSH